MATQYLDCPKCDDEIEFQIEYEHADDGSWFSASFVQRDCHCEISDVEMLQLEEDAAFAYAEGVHNYEP